MQKQQDDQFDFKKKREQFTINLRRTNREETINRRRNMPSENIGGSDKETSKIKVIDKNYEQHIIEFQKQKFQTSQINDLLTAMQNGDIVQKHWGIIGIRKILHHFHDSKVPMTLCTIGGVPLIFQFAKQAQYPHLRFQAFWSIANLSSASSEVCAYLGDLGILELLNSGMDSQNSEVIQNAIWGFGNMAADKIEIRDKILNMGILQKIANYAEGLTDKKKYQDACWSIANLSRGNPSPSYQIIKVGIPVLGNGLKNNFFHDDQMLSDILWTCAYLTEGPKIRLTRFQETGACPAIFKCLENSYAGVYIPALRIIGNFSSGYQTHTDILLQNSFLDIALILLDHSKPIVRKEVSWILSNIAAGTPQQSVKLLSKPLLIHKLVTMLDSDRADVKVQILWLFAILQRTGISKDIFQLYRVTGVVEKSLHLLDDKSQYVLVNTLQCLYKFLKLGEKIQKKTSDMDDQNPIKREVVEKGLFNKLIPLQNHESKKVYEAVCKILQTHFENNLQIQE